MQPVPEWPTRDHPGFVAWFDRFYLEMADWIRQRIRYHLGNNAHAPDLVEDLFPILYTHLREHWNFTPERGEVKPWLNAIIGRQVIDSLRRRQRDGKKGSGRGGDDDPLQDLPDQPEKSAPRFSCREQQVAKALARFRERISPRQFMLFYLTELREAIEGKRKCTLEQARDLLNLDSRYRDSQLPLTYWQCWQTRQRMRDELAKCLTVCGVEKETANWWTVGRILYEAISGEVDRSGATPGQEGGPQ